MIDFANARGLNVILESWIRGCMGLHGVMVYGLWKRDVGCSSSK